MISEEARLPAPLNLAVFCDCLDRRTAAKNQSLLISG